jgi:nicotinate-nucleotide adenylyltransferase
VNAAAASKIGIFGGTFDPPHTGHLIAAQDASEQLQLDRFVFVPAAEPPHKRGKSVTPAPVRLAMLRAAAADNPLFEICTLELERDGPSYTVDTLRELAGQYRGARLQLLIGVDQVRDFAQWREPQAIRELADVVMLTRAGDVEPGPEAAFVKQIVHVTRADISSTLIRERVAAGRPIRYLVPDAVAALIAREGLYR